MKKKLQYYAKEILLFFLVMFVAANAISYYRSSDLNRGKLEKEAFTLLWNEPYTLKKDRPVMVHFWATWCPVCTLEAPNIESLSKEYEVITIAVRSGTDQKLKQFLQKEGYGMHTVNDFKGELAKEFGVAVYPSTFIYDKNGKLIFSEVGYTSALGLRLRMWWASF